MGAWSWSDSGCADSLSGGRCVLVAATLLATGAAVASCASVNEPVVLTAGYYTTVGLN